MKFSLVSTLVVALAAEATASTWFGKPAYNKWHETELERWLSDHDVAYPKASDRKDLENLVKNNWNDKVVSPYNTWDAPSLQNYLTLKGHEAKKGTEQNTESLAEQVKGYWTETEDSTNQAYASVRDWIFDSWTDSQLKAFADKHNIPVPQPRARDSLLKVVRDNYQSAADKASETAAYPGDWLYSSWSDSDLKSWCDTHGYNVPQPSSRDKLIATIRRQSRLASLNLNSAVSSASASAYSAKASLGDALLDSWSDSQIKEWADKNGVKVPQGSNRNELLALARKHKASLLGENVSATATSAYGAATSNASSHYNQATKGFGGYTNWVKAMIGLPTGYTASASTVSASASSAGSAVSSSASSLSSVASKSAQKGYDAVTESVIKASDYVKEEL
ncbi:hypothetical protein K504DRAFT_401720 [Pleomassaria siparia CBS 279.74]|uniref:Stress response protein ish1 n=1 Tax=Pleomassaria siparia CBS 279.74 TaxID=1314801 RepID=A0A6G1KJC3_9PLEO|nr:hypothetical protein K504DRAFT_401720 [Pleomassaria siparia CBS 279.74]